MLVTGALIGILPASSWGKSIEVDIVDGSQANYKEGGIQHRLSDVEGISQSETVKVRPQSLEDISYNLITSLYTRHWNPDPEHNNDSRLISLERQSGDAMWGLTLFKNSFDQDSQLVYWAKNFSLEEYVYIPCLRSKWFFGLIHGYKGEYKNRIPFNQLGVAPAILPTIGIATRYVEADLIFLGFNAVTVIVTLPIRF